MPFGKNIRIYCNIQNNSHLFQPLYRHSFEFLCAPNVADIKKFQLEFNGKSESVSVKLKFYRLKNGLTQNEVAAYLGLDRKTYARYESNSRTYYPPDVIDKLCVLFNIGAYEILDPYNQFIYDGQARNLKLLREKLKITQAQLASILGVPTARIKKWEQSVCRIPESIWERLPNIMGKD